MKPGISRKPPLRPSKAPENPKKTGLFIMEQSILRGGNLLKELAIYAHRMDPDNAKLKKIIDSINELSIAETALQEEKEKRTELERTIPDYQSDPRWTELDSKLIRMSTELVQPLEKARNKILETEQGEIYSVLRMNGIDILLYDHQDKSLETTLLADIQKLQSKAQYDCIILGGGHGGQTVFSGLAESNVNKLVQNLVEKDISSNLVCLGSCESMGFASRMQNLVTDKDRGVVIGYLGDCTNFFLSDALPYLLGDTETFIPFDPYGDDSETLDKKTSLGLMTADLGTVFELGEGAAKNKDNLHHWRTSMRTLFWGPLERAIYNRLNETYYPKLDQPLNKIMVLGNNTPQDTLAALTYKGPSEPSNALREELKGQQPHITTTENASAPFGVNVNAKFKAFLKHYMESDMYVEDVDEAMIDEVCAVLPQVQTRVFSMNVEERLNLINRAIASVVPPRNRATGLSTAPIEREMVELRLNERRFSMEQEVDNYVKPGTGTPIDVKR